jgi:hypothetical protein
VIAIGTGGRAPALASRLRAELDERFGPDWTELVDVVGRVRAATLPHLPDFEDRSRRWKAALDLDELERLVAAGQGTLAATRLHDRLLEGLPEGLGGPVDSPTHPPAPVGYAPPPGDPAAAGRGPARPGAPDPAPDGEGRARPAVEGAA